MNKLTAVAHRFFDTAYVLKFVLRLLALYLFLRLVNWLMIGAIVPDGYYSPFIDNHLNYVTVIKVSVLQTAGWLAALAGVDTYLLDHSNLQIVGSRHVFMAWACCGLEVMSFWAAFALADTTPWRQKIAWCLGGLACIWFINCLRVGVLVVAVKNRWPQIGTIRHHDTFDVLAYGLVFLLMLVYYKKNGRQWGL